MTAAPPRRQRAYVVGYETGPDGQVRAFSVRCPYCRGRHRHAAWRSTEYASAWCGTPGGAYAVIWPEPMVVDDPHLGTGADVGSSDVVSLIQDDMPALAEAAI